MILKGDVSSRNEPNQSRELPDRDPRRPGQVRQINNYRLYKVSAAQGTGRTSVVTKGMKLFDTPAKEHSRRASLTLLHAQEEIRMGIVFVPAKFFVN